MQIYYFERQNELLMTSPPTPWQLPTATAFGDEVLYVYHWLDASRMNYNYIGSVVVDIQ